MQNKQYFRPTKALINLQAIHKNIQQLKSLLQPNVQIIAVVKANAYGHGDVEVAKAAIDAGATILAVATPEEALHLRRHFPTMKILLLGFSPVHFAPYAAEENITLTAYSKEWVKQVNTQYTSLNALKVHIKVDTGMGRIGVTSSEELLELYDEISSNKQLVIEGIFTHFATADEDDELYFMEQVKLFHHFMNVLPQKPRIVHAANTATAYMKHPMLQFDAVRFGISMYGLAPSNFIKSNCPVPLYPSFSLETELTAIKEIEAGQSIGYGNAFTATDRCYIGTIPIGYADGLLRKLSGQDVLINGERVPIIGRICMDQCMILLPNAYNIGEKVTLIGKQQKEEITVDEWAMKLDTINYEIPCTITSRVPRIYIKKE